MAMPLGDLTKPEVRRIAAERARAVLVVELSTGQMIEDVQDFANEHPERVAEAIQSWIYEEDWNQQRSRSSGGAG